MFVDVDVSLIMKASDQIPDFLIEELKPLEDKTLYAVATYAESDGLPPDEVPDDFSTAFALQDDETLAAIARYARTLAEKDRNTTTEVTETDSDNDDSAENDERDPNSSLFSNGW